MCGFYVNLVIYPKCAMEAVWQYGLFGHVWMQQAGFSFNVDVIVLHDAIARYFRFL